MREIPKWLADNTVQERIKNLLDLDQCMEEEERLQLERCAIQEWMVEEWNCVQAKLAVCGSFSLMDVVKMLVC